MDLEILQATAGQKKLDDVMNTMYYQYYYKLARGYTDVEFKDMAGKIAGKSMEVFYNDYVYGTKKPDYNAFLKVVGYQLVDDNASKNEPYLGITASGRTGKFLITSVARNSPAWRDGLNVNDELLTINDEKVSGTMAEIDKAVAAKTVSEKLKIGIIRDGLQITIDLTLARNPAVRYRFVSLDSPSKEQLLLRAKWLAL
jgi:predicted metalloprotease with PDZ domain